ncbi:MAG TPA: hypothetical protein VIG49_09725 [Acetobacteraceae bacterium]
MADYPADSSAGGGYPSAMGERVAILETIAAETRTALLDLRLEMRDTRTEMRTEMRAMRQDMNAGFADVRRVHDRDFRMTWGAFIGASLGLLYLLAHTAHWL